MVADVAEWQRFGGVAMQHVCEPYNRYDMQAWGEIRVVTSLDH